MRVLVADDHSLFRDGLVSLLEAAGYEIVGQVGDGQAAVEMTHTKRPDLVLLDLTMPKLNGHEALLQIRATVPETKVVILTVSDDDVDLHRAIRAGAHGYLLKSLNADQLLEMLAGLKDGEAAITRKTAARLIAQLADPSSVEDQVRELLTGRERQILRLVSQGLSNRAIAQTLSISMNTVKYHMKNIFQKLAVQNRTEAVAYAIRTGLLSPEDQSPDEQTG
ncbi:MAG: response regulator [Anaerolineales bacterium]|nr:response regulator [Anaerolineales bacterium]